MKKVLKSIENTANWVFYVFRAYCKALYILAKNRVRPNSVKLTFRDILPKPDFSMAERRILRGSAATAIAAVFAVAAVITVAADNINADGAPPVNKSIDVIAEQALDADDEAAGADMDNAAEEDTNAVFAITANGKDIIFMASYEDAEAVLNGITDRYKTIGSEVINLGYKESVSIEKRDLGGNAQEFSIAEAVSYIITGSSEPRTYIVKGGDSLWDIAIANGISLSALQEMNPGLNPKRLSIGQEIFLYETKPFITVTFTEVVSNEERIAYSVVYEENDSLYRGQTQVMVPGTYGSRQVRSEVTKENGVVVSSVVLEDVLISEPASQVTLRGTQPLPVYTGTSTGELSNPLAEINVISNYGNRGGRQHHGVDLKGPVGTPIYAAADGVVVFSGSSGTFGNIVKLSHGGGLETWYAHNSANIVSVGEAVVKGQQIAEMGATGNATTSHLHFEVRINGSSKNPMNYL